MKTRYRDWFVAALLGALVLMPALHAEDKQAKQGQGLRKTEGTPIRTYLNINNISTVFKNDGIADIDVGEQNSGLVFPKGSRKTAVFQSGLLWGARVGGAIHVGGSAYRSGLQGGKILSPGIAESPDLGKNRIYRVRPDYKTADLSSEVRDEGGSQSTIRAQYERDWNEWPATDGAPYTDVNNNGRYDPATDIPGVKGADQTIWFVANDLNSGLTTQLYGTNPMGIEVQVTIWAYSQQGALGNMFFKKYLLVNKSTNTFTDMYVSQWSDPDLGNSTDDYAGCDTTLSLGYVYNANAVDATYGDLPPPAVGFDFFQGPVVSSTGSTAIFKGKRINGYRNLPMTAFYYFARGDATVTDPTQGDPAGAQQFYNFFQGRIGLNGNPFTDPNTGRTTSFALAGDPQARSGWIDGQLLPPGDRRIGLSSGPFTMAPQDTQEIVVAELAAGAIPGVDRLSAIGLLKFYDQQAQLAYDNFFDLPVPPSAPSVKVAELDGQIVLDWGSDITSMRATESSNVKGFKFQGYNVYQLPSLSSTLDQAKRIATYDIVDGISKIEDKVFDASTGVVATKVRQFGNDTGIKHVLSLRADEVRGGAPLVNGIRYYYAVTSYSYNPDPNAVPNNLENPLAILTVVPHTTSPGVRFGAVYGDTVFATKTGVGDGRTLALVVDPTRLTGANYKVVFATQADATVWNLVRTMNGRVDTVLKNQTNQTGDDTSPIVDGMMIKVFGPALDFKSMSMVSNGNGAITQKVGYDVTPAPSYNGYSADWYRDVATGDGTVLNLANGMTSKGGWFFVVAGGPNIVDYQSAVGRWTRNGAAFSKIIPNDYEIRFTARGGKAWMAFTDGALVDVPFEIWYIGSGTPNDPSDDIRMMPWINDDNGNGVFDFKLDHQASGGNNDPYSDWIYFMMPEPNAPPGEAAYNRAVTRSSDPNYAGDVEIEHLVRVVLMNWNQHQGAGGVNEMPEAGTTFRIDLTKPSKPGVDSFSFTAPAVTVNQDVAKADLNKINVFPNPYYGVNTEELNKYQRFVTFTHLPDNAKIRIFNLAGVLVRTIEHNQPGSQFERWDLSNDNGLPVASGLYIAYVDMPSLGTKVLKIAVIQERQILDRF
ncbi:MAG: T9SS type A sorting domain-containing protein [Ignavibacteriales bacterium]|nr:T9SS type A sorting domain-containing protein [Ignavibacteriales bacterium]